MSQESVRSNYNHLQKNVGKIAQVLKKLQPQAKH